MCLVSVVVAGALWLWFARAFIVAAPDELQLHSPFRSTRHFDWNHLEAAGADMWGNWIRANGRKIYWARGWFPARRAALGALIETQSGPKIALVSKCPRGTMRADGFCLKCSMFPRFRFALPISAVLCGGALIIAPTSSHAAPAKSTLNPPWLRRSGPRRSTAGITQMADEALENRWSFRASPTAFNAGEARAVFGYQRRAQFRVAARRRRRKSSCGTSTNGAARKLGAKCAQRGRNRACKCRASAFAFCFSNAQIVIEAHLKPAGDSIRRRHAEGGFSWDAGDVQPTAAGGVSAMISCAQQGPERHGDSVRVEN